MAASPRLRRANVVTALIIMPVLFAAWVILYWFPTRTDDLWAWTINSEMTPVTMGSGYLGGVWFFSRIARNPSAHRAVGGLAAAGVFVWGLGLATVIHWEKFHHLHVAFWAWSALYFVTPFFVPGLVVANWRAADRDVEPTPVPTWAVWVLVSTGITQMVAAVTWFISPHLAIDNWPWPMTPLTTRTIASFVAFSGGMLLWVLVDRRWAAVQGGVEALTIGLTVTLTGALVHRDDFTGSDAGTVLYVVALVYLLVMFTILLVQMNRRASGATTIPARPSAHPG